MLKRYRCLGVIGYTEPQSVDCEEEESQGKRGKRHKTTQGKKTH